jgi:hypothetical protein
VPEKFKPKYGFEGFKIKNSFLDRNFSRSEMHFELKIGKSRSVS